MQKRISPDYRSGIFSHMGYRQTYFVEIGSDRNVCAVKGCDFLLAVYPLKGRFNHQELAGSRIPLELDTAHPYQGHPLEKRFCERLQDCAYVRSSGAAGRETDIQWPNAQLAAGTPNDHGGWSRASASPWIQSISNATAAYPTPQVFRAVTLARSNIH